MYIFSCLQLVKCVIQIFMLVVLDMTDNVDKMRHGQEALQSSTHREHATNNPRGHGRRVQYFAKTFSL